MIPKTGTQRQWKHRLISTSLPMSSPLRASARSLGFLMGCTDIGAGEVSHEEDDEDVPTNVRGPDIGVLVRLYAIHTKLVFDHLVQPCIEFCYSFTEWFSFRLHRYMRCRLLLPMFTECQSVCQSVTRLNSASLCKNGWTDQDAVWSVHSWGPNEHCIRPGSWSPNIEGREIRCSLCQITLACSYRQAC